MVLGVRPEALAPGSPARVSGDPATQGKLTAKVWLVQPLGAQMDVYLSTPLHERIVARTESAPSPAVDETVSVAVDMSRAHFFEPGDNGTALA